MQTSGLFGIMVYLLVAVIFFTWCQYNLSVALVNRNSLVFDSLVARNKEIEELFKHK